MICMQELNVNILKLNIEQLRKAAGVSQPDLAKAIGMSQPNLSKALNPKYKQTFTLAQIYKLAQFFNTSVDALIGGVATTAVGPRAIAAFFANLLETKQIEPIKVDIEEDIPSKRKIFDRKENVQYNAFFLPNYYNDEDYMELFDVGKTTDPGHPNYKVNSFLNEFMAILQMKNSGSLSKDSFQAFYLELLKAVPETTSSERPKRKLNF